MDNEKEYIKTLCINVLPDKINIHIIEWTNQFVNQKMNKSSRDPYTLKINDKFDNVKII